jgi:hypothetical protein
LGNRGCMLTTTKLEVADCRGKPKANKVFASHLLRPPSMSIFCQRCYRGKVIHHHWRKGCVSSSSHPQHDSPASRGSGTVHRRCGEAEGGTWQSLLLLPRGFVILGAAQGNHAISQLDSLLWIQELIFSVPWNWIHGTITVRWLVKFFSERFMVISSHFYFYY